MNFIPPTYEDGTDTVFWNVGIYNSDAGELPKTKHNIFRTRRKFEIKSVIINYFHFVSLSINAVYLWCCLRCCLYLRQHSVECYDELRLMNWKRYERSGRGLFEAILRHFCERTEENPYSSIHFSALAWTWTCKLRNTIRNISVWATLHWFIVWNLL